jgi:hypothetical protein
MKLKNRLDRRILPIWIGMNPKQLVPQVWIEKPFRPILEIIHYHAAAWMHFPERTSFLWWVDRPWNSDTPKMAVQALSRQKGDEQIQFSGQVRFFFVSSRTMCESTTFGIDP